MSSPATSDARSDWHVEKMCINIAFAVGGPMLVFGVFVGTDGHMVAGAVLYVGSLIATAIRDTASRR